MYYGKPESISLKIDKDWYTLLHDYFGDRYQFVEHIDDTWAVSYTHLDVYKRQYLDFAESDGLFGSFLLSSWQQKKLLLVLSLIHI